MKQKLFILENATSFGLKHATIYCHTKENYFSIDINGESAQEEDYRKGVHYSNTIKECKRHLSFHFRKSTNAKWMKVTR